MMAQMAGVPVTAASGESIEGSSFASLFAAGVDPAKVIWTNSHNGSFTQYPRCGENATYESGLPNFSAAKRCAHVVKRKFDYMGYSIRTSDYRFTEWARCDYFLNS